VLEMSPAAGTQLPKGSTVNLIVAKQPKQVAVPDVTTNAVNDAVNALEQAGFGVRQKEKKTTNPDEDGIVLSQNPPGGEKHDRGSKVTITVGRFDPGNLDPNATPTPTPTPSPTPACATVPNLVGKTFANARTAWTAAGFTGAFSPANGQNKFIVGSQNRAPGDCLPPSTTITVTTAP
jgi:beta-lactam-binding protein with PASTA domain